MLSLFKLQQLLPSRPPSSAAFPSPLVGITRSSHMYFIYWSTVLGIPLGMWPRVFACFTPNSVPSAQSKVWYMVDVHQQDWSCA